MSGYRGFRNSRVQWAAPARGSHPCNLRSHDPVPNRHYGDGNPIEPAALDCLRAAYEAECVRVLWQAGDVLVLDNLLAAHGREPFTGQRLVVVGMGNVATWDEVAP